MADINAQVSAMSITAELADAGRLQTKVAGQALHRQLADGAEQANKIAAQQQQIMSLEMQIRTLQSALNNTMLSHAESANKSVDLQEKMSSLEFKVGSQSREITSLTEQLNQALTALSAAVHTLQHYGPMSQVLAEIEEKGANKTKVAKHPNTVFSDSKSTTKAQPKTNTALPTLTPPKPKGSAPAA